MKPEHMRRGRRDNRKKPTRREAVERNTESVERLTSAEIDHGEASAPAPVKKKTRKKASKGARSKEA